MSTEPDYNFNEPVSATAPAGPSLHLPFALVTSALAIFMFAQTINIFFNQKNLRENREQLNQGKIQLADAYRNRQPMVEDSTKIQKRLHDMLVDLLLLAKTDEDAKAIVTKFNIQLPSTPETPAPAAAPAP